ncbi:hypothetical protein ACFQHW_03265 [Lapidilactobacillus achengensis]|uniref:Uncharacterized protein n=1 Tax=Lapidilactobacillus achengensis TaxID=2486000 RepID=A0ABW1UKW8_9LACO|nr:hypothetical protein [Lapidilactobacillus achengensis]
MRWLDIFTCSLNNSCWKQTDSVDFPRTSFDYQTDCAGVTNLKLVTTSNGRHLRGTLSIDNSLPIGASAQTAVITLSGWSGAWCWWSVYSLAEGRAGGESAAILLLAIYRLQ